METGIIFVQCVKITNQEREYMKLFLSILGIGILFIGIPVLTAVYAYGTKDNVECTVKEKERVVSGDSSRYLIFCEEEVLQNTDSLWKWSSSDFYKDIDEGEKYNFTVYGWRVPFLSMYKNIIEINQTK